MAVSRKGVAQNPEDVKPSSFNQTAYRILQLVAWLSKTPLTFEEINDRFQADPYVGKRLSQDTFWLYLNTLKMLGCQISRPTSRNGYCYELLYHPFTYFLTPHDVRILQECRQRIEDDLPFWDVFHLNRWLIRVFENTANKNRDEMMHRFFTETRTFNLKSLTPTIEALLVYCEKGQLLEIHYLSSSNGKITLAFLPKKLIHHNGLPYLLGQSDRKEKSSMLRIDKIQKINPLDKPDLKKQLQQKQAEKQVYIIRILNCEADRYLSLEKEESISPDPDAPQHLLVELKSDNEFLLKQKLLSLGYAFQVIYPRSFQLDLQKTLETMRGFYTP